MCSENECEEIFFRQSAKFTGPLVLAKHAVRSPWTVTTMFTKSIELLLFSFVTFHHSINYIQYQQGALVTYLKAECN